MLAGISKTTDCMLGAREEDVPIESCFGLLPGGLLRIFRTHLDEVMLRVTLGSCVSLCNDPYATANASLEGA